MNDETPYKKPQKKISGYSVFIKRLRLLMPIGIALIFAALFLWPQFKAHLPVAFDMDFDLNLRASENTVLSPRFESLDTAGRPYIVTAETAKLGGNNQERITLASPRGRMKLNDSYNLYIRSDEGIFNRSENMLELKDNVTFTHNQGYKMSTQRMSFALETGEGYTNAPVTVEAGEYTLEASAAEMLEDGDVIKFIGPVSLNGSAMTLTAQDRLVWDRKAGEYRAFGNVNVIRNDDRLRADQMTAYYTMAGEQYEDIRRIEAQDNVVITTPEEQVKASQGDYDVGAELVTLNGGVTILRDDLEIKGARAEVDLKTNVSRLLGGATSSAPEPSTNEGSSSDTTTKTEDGRIKGFFELNNKSEGYIP